MTSALTACCAARVVTRVPSASVHMRRNVLMNTRRASKQARVSVTTKASGEWGPPPSVAKSPERVSLEVQTMDSHTNNIQTGYERGDSTRGLADERRDIAAKAKQLMNIDPNDPRALDAIGSKVKCHVQFRVPYNTAHGEDLFIIGSHDSLGLWNQNNALSMTWGEGGNWWANVDLPAGGVFFYKYAVRGIDGSYKWQEGANNLLVLPDEWDIPQDSLFIVDDNFSGISRSSQNMLASKVISYEKEIVTLRMETVKAKEMTKASLQELLITREELEEANIKLAQYESNVQKVIDSMQGNASSQRTR
jgi:hypothetical protein|tara:strand:- start:1130 stop:2047 length:918 start_codon:yes stop_codon:yes gene_type:complete